MIHCPIHCLIGTKSTSEFLIIRYVVLTSASLRVLELDLSDIPLGSKGTITLFEHVGFAGMPCTAIIDTSFPLCGSFKGRNGLGNESNLNRT